MGKPHGIFNKSDAVAKCLFWVSPTGKLPELFWGIHTMAEQAPDASAFFAPDVQYVVPGHNALSGTTTGAAAVMGYFGKLMALSGGSYAIGHMTWLVCGDDKVLLQTDNSATVQGRPLVWKEAIVFTFRDGLKARIEMFQADQRAVDALFGPPAGP